MKKLLNFIPGADLINTALLIIRIGIAGMMLVHGLPKLEMLVSGDSNGFPEILGIGPGLSLTLAVLAEVLCSLFLLLGFGTRLAAIPLIITMGMAVFYIHANDPFSSQELGLHYLLTYVVLLILGGGGYSLDALWAKKKYGNLEKGLN